MNCGSTDALSLSEHIEREVAEVGGRHYQRNHVLTRIRRRPTSNVAQSAPGAVRPPILRHRHNRPIALSPGRFDAHPVRGLDPALLGHVAGLWL